jgi:endonuclease/exonuclease/phosphatase family metal-dependent hydrolase
MRIVSYNILDGGEGRADPLAEVILAQRPDIVALIEADDAAVVERVANRAKMDYIHGKAGKKGAAILSRWTVRETVDHAYFLPEETAPKSLLEAKIIGPDGASWLIAAIHLTARAMEADEQKREREIAAVLERFKHHRDANRPHLLVGDFNANAPYQEIDPQKCKPATREAWVANGGRIPRRVVQTILDAGYIDSLEAVDPLAARTRGSFSTQDPGQRVDYIFTFGIPRAKIKAGWIEQDRLAKYASDHFPIGAEIELTD